MSSYNPVMQDISSQLTPGVRVKVTQQIAARARTVAIEVTGTVMAFQQQTTGSWFAHSIQHRLWLDRLVLKKDDGEISTLILDQYTRIDLV